MKIRPVRRYACGCCDTVHEHRDQADACCRPTVESVDMYPCPKCEELHDDEPAALACCGVTAEELPEIPGVVLSPAEFLAQSSLF